ncbi:SPJ_0845 family protein [Pediococcus pentosaceus]|nr:SPJ_0845 family protein [Pediococcus pentosaceus]
MGFTVKRNDNLEKMFDQLTTQTKTSVEEKEKKNKFLAKGTNKKDSKK